MNKQRGYYTVKIGGKNRIFHFSMNFWAALTDELNIGLDELDSIFGNRLSLSTLRAIVYSAALAYDQENNILPNYNIYNAGEWLSDINEKELESIVNAMTESRILGNDINGGVKRNVVKTTKSGKGKK